MLKEVRITWLDPCSDRIMLDKVPVGRGALAKWIERGVIDDVTDGVVRFIQSYAFSPGHEEADEAIIGWITEDSIEKIEILTVERENQ